MPRHLWGLVFAISALATSGCPRGDAATLGAPEPMGASTRGPTHDEVSFQRDVEPILISGCSGEFCHGNNVNTPKRAYLYLVNQPSDECGDGRVLVAPSHPEASYVLDKVEDRHLCAGESMPRGLWNRLPAEQIVTLRTWIAEGAPYN